MMIKKAWLKDFNATSYTATVQIDGSMGIWMENVPVSRGIPAEEMINGRPCALIFFDENPQNVVLTAIFA